MERLAKLGVSGEKAQEILRAPVPKGESEPVLKISDSNVRNFLMFNILSFLSSMFLKNRKFILLIFYKYNIQLRAHLTHNR